MNRRTIITFLLLILIFNIFITLIPNFIWGFNSIWGADLYYYFDRVNSIYFNNNTIFNSFSMPDQITTYPPGIIIIFLNLKYLTGLNNFGLDIIFRIMFYLLFIIIIFMFIKKISSNLILPSLIMTPLIHSGIYVEPANGYTIFVVGRSGSSTIILSFVMFLFIFWIIYHLFRHHIEMRFVLLLFLFFSSAGLSHIGGLIWIAVFLIVLIVYFIIINVNKNNMYNVNKLLLIMGTIFLSIINTFILYYYKALQFLYERKALDVNISRYIGQKIEFTPQTMLLILIVLFCGSISYPLYYKFKKDNINFNEPIEAHIKKKSTFLVIIIGYLLIFVIGSILFTIKSPKAYSNALIGFPFTIYFGPPFSLITILSKLFGVMIFILILFGLIYFYNTKTNITQFHTIMVLYLLGYFLSFSFLLPVSFLPTNRMLFGNLIFFPFITAAGLYYYAKAVIQVPKKNLFEKGVENTIFISITVIIVLSPCISLSNLEPTMSDTSNTQNLFNIGHLSNTTLSSEIVKYITTNINSNTYLASPEIQSRIGSISSIEVISSINDNIIFGSADSKYNMIDMAFNLDSTQIHRYSTEYNTNYFIVSNLDLVKYNKNISDYSNQDYLIKVYSNSVNDTIYYIS